MARTPHTPAEGVEHLGLSGTVLLAGAPAGWPEAAASLEETTVLVTEAPAEIEQGAKVTDAKPDDTAGTVVLWAGPVPPHDIRTWIDRVADGGSMWVVLPKRDAKGLTPVSEPDLKRSLLIRGWRDDRMVATGPDTYAIRFRRRR